MPPLLGFCREALPDACGLRRLNPKWDAGMTDVQVIEAALEARRESHGNDFLPLHLHQVAVIGCVFRDDNGFRVKTLGAADDPEATLLSGRSEERRVGKECVSTWRSRGSPFH